MIELYPLFIQFEYKVMETYEMLSSGMTIKIKKEE